VVSRRGRATAPRTGRGLAHPIVGWSGERLPVRVREPAPAPRAEGDGSREGEEHEERRDERGGGSNRLRQEDDERADDEDGDSGRECGHERTFRVHGGETNPGVINERLRVFMFVRA
jgi:hypothetical protein